MCLSMRRVVQEKQEATSLIYIGATRHRLWPDGGAYLSAYFDNWN